MPETPDIGKFPEIREVTVPDLGEVDSVEVIEVIVSVGDIVGLDQPLVTLESDKASMDIPSPSAGKITAIQVAVGDRVSTGSPIVAIVDLEPAGEGAPSADDGDVDEAVEDPAARPTFPDGGGDRDADVVADAVVLGAGPGGYTAAFRAADLGLRTVLVERYPTLGGVCLNVGCIPSKALLHTAAVINASVEMSAHGVHFGTAKIDLPKLSAWKDSVVSGLTDGLAGLADRRKVSVMVGVGRFTSEHTLEVDTADGTTTVRFQHAIIAAGSQATALPGFPVDPRIMDSTDALKLEDLPRRLLVVGGGIIGLEMATVYQALGSEVTVVELLDGLMPGCDRDLVRHLHERLSASYQGIYLGTRVTEVKPQKRAIKVSMEGPDAPEIAAFERILVAVGRRPNGNEIGAERAGIHVEPPGFIPVDRQQRTNVPHIFAIGDIVGQPMLAHKATHEGKVAAEVAAGMKASFDALAVPSVAYTDPEVAWTGLTEEEAKAHGIAFDKGVFPWAASGRALGMGRDDGMTKLLFDRDDGRLLGAGIVGPHAGELIAEATLAIEMGADAADLALTIHPHPTLSETINFAAEIVEGTVTDLYVPRKNGR